jgi:quinate dehydrogenase (quinone)
MDEQQGSGRRIFFTVYRVIFVLLSFCTGLFFTFWGGKLLTLGGSAWYLLPEWPICLSPSDTLSAVNTSSFHHRDLLTDPCWALYEVQLSYWGLIPRLVVPALLLMLACGWRRRCRSTRRGPLRQLERLGDFHRAAGDAGLGVLPARRHSSRRGESRRDSNAPRFQSDNWAFFARDASGTRFAPYDEITPENVKNLKWRGRTTPAAG